MKRRRSADSYQLVSPALDVLHHLPRAGDAIHPALRKRHRLPYAVAERLARVVKKVGVTIH